MTQNLFQPLYVQTGTNVYRYFDGIDWKESESGKYIPIISPMDGEVVGQIQALTKNEVDSIVSRASLAQKEWNSIAIEMRRSILSRVASLIREQESFLTQLMVKEIGKSSAESKSEILRTADLIDATVKETEIFDIHTVDGDTYPGYRGRSAILTRVPYGVVLAIAPFNYPINLAASKIVPALLMGNTVIFKPPTQGTICGLHLARLFEVAGLPKGVLSAVTGSGHEIGSLLIAHKKVNMVAFTGSSEVGKTIASQALMKPLLLECSGNNAAIIADDVNIEKAAKEIVKGAFAYAGQRCTAIKYVMGEKQTLDRLLPIVLESIKNATLETPVISEESAIEIERHIVGAIDEGALCAFGGKRTKAFIEPTVLTGVTPSMKIVDTEVFGPVISFIEVSDIPAAIEIINHQRFGLQTSLFINDEEKGKEIAKQIDVGTVQINGSPQRGPDHFPFLGIRDSGLGVQGIKFALESMCRIKSVIVTS